jgi:hypothetical protein
MSSIPATAFNFWRALEHKPSLLSVLFGPQPHISITYFSLFTNLSTILLFVKNILRHIKLGSVCEKMYPRPVMLYSHYSKKNFHLFERGKRACFFFDVELHEVWL